MAAAAGMGTQVHRQQETWGLLVGAELPTILASAASEGNQAFKQQEFWGLFSRLRLQEGSAVVLQV
jgi:hypothetical protein